MKKKNRLQMLAALLIATLSMALTSPIAAKANEEYNVGTTKETDADIGRIYYLKNSHGDVIGQMDENGNLLTSYAYNAFGEQVSAVATKGEQKSTTNRFLYAGEQYDETSGFYYLRARHYDVRGYISANSANRVSLDKLASTPNAFPNGSITTTTVGAIRGIGMDVIPDPSSGNPYHAAIVPLNNPMLPSEVRALNRLFDQKENIWK